MRTGLQQLLTSSHQAIKWLNTRTSGATHRYSGGGPGISQKGAKPPPVVAAQGQLGSGTRGSNKNYVTKKTKRFAGTGNRTGRYSNPCERSHGRRGTNIVNLFGQKCAKFRDLAGKTKSERIGSRRGELWRLLQNVTHGRTDGRAYRRCGCLRGSEFI